MPDVKEQLKKGMKVGNKTFKVHLDGYNLTDAFAGKAPSPRWKRPAEATERTCCAQRAVAHDA